FWQRLLTKKAGSFFSCHFIFMMFSSDHIYQMHPAFFSIFDFPLPTSESSYASHGYVPDGLFFRARLHGHVPLTS
ncbi:hypothetical protein P9G49_12015, partial [Heyndrickxia coagulans]|uniref:hypothetical protein n=1 Tax=Heyndrickxia coagulans TaxID=1398 RepID=UPI002E03963E|nr:hypothetical protein [Heyndrickxia coagulans]